MHFILPNCNNLDFFSNALAEFKVYLDGHSYLGILLKRDPLRYKHIGDEQNVDYHINVASYVVRNRIQARRFELLIELTRFSGLRSEN